MEKNNYIVYATAALMSLYGLVRGTSDLNNYFRPPEKEKVIIRISTDERDMDLVRIETLDSSRTYLTHRRDGTTIKSPELESIIGKSDVSVIRRR